ncbi:hypothetical protein GJ744_005925 [Endocarpon pusillum]|uniref:Uncharacterized protein n=1 Tax=Endocarpon pusillum TaxID=364733 RepID=A0A8H7AKJ3_9EURO|nr:hypothetical protein GJ744_005925 [Endocarpon pusillum]
MHAQHPFVPRTSTFFKFAKQIAPINCSLIRHLSLTPFADSLSVQVIGSEKQFREIAEEFVHLNTGFAYLPRQEQEVKCLLVWRYTILIPKTRTKTAVYNVNTDELEFVEDSYLFATLKELLL